MSTVFIYAGQGSQKVGMGLDFYETYPEYREFIDSLQVGIDLKRLMHEGALEELSKTENTQACMAAFAAGVTKLFAMKGILPDEACGLSLGEYGALYAAGTFTAEEYVALTAFRGNAMMEAAKGCSCAMSAVLGTDAAMVEEAVNAYDGDAFITVANYNCPGQYVICGDDEAVEAVEADLKSKGVKRCVRLNVSGPFHTKYMQPAGEALRGYFETISFEEPKIPVLLNVTGDYYKEGDDLKELLVKQVQNSVRLEDQLRKLIEKGHDNFIEIGPGNTIAGFLKKTARAMKTKVNVVSIDTVEDFKKVTGE
ncbi:MAG: ACP S-malonyltransferase [Eubacteriales bacterium]|nr:ACP S-malonyltransferase [Eubacteriales bacterium]